MKTHNNTAPNVQEAKNMNAKTTKTVMKCIGAAMGVGSAAMMMASAKGGSMSTKKAIKKTANKIANVVDTVSAFM